MSKMRIVWTGFEPFGEHSYNPSWDVARAADGACGEGVSSRAERLAVEFEAVEHWAGERFPSGERLLLVGFGLAEMRSMICLEGRARNVVGTRADEAGATVQGRDRLAASGPDEIRPALELEELRNSLAERLAETRTPFPEVEISDDAGTFVCNALYYQALKSCSGEDDALFVHVPPLAPQQAGLLGRQTASALLNELE